MLGLWGTFAYLAWVVPQRLALDIAADFEKLRRHAILLAAASVAFWLPLKAATIGEGWSDAFNGKTLAAVLYETTAGQIWRWEASATTILLATMLPLLARRGKSASATATAAGLAILPLAFINHAAEHGEWLGAAQRANDALHLLAAGAWVGALVPLLFVLRALDTSPSCEDAQVALRRFSSLGHAVVAIVVATGAFNAIVVLKDVRLDIASPYQALLAIKIALVLVMVGLALVNRYGAIPALPTRHDAAIRVLRARTVAEIALGAVVVLLVAVFGLLDP